MDNGIARKKGTEEKYSILSCFLTCLEYWFFLVTMEYSADEGMKSVRFHYALDIMQTTLSSPKTTSF